MAMGENTGSRVRASATRICTARKLMGAKTTPSATYRAAIIAPFTIRFTLVCFMGIHFSFRSVV